MSECQFKESNRCKLAEQILEAGFKLQIVCGVEESDCSACLAKGMPDAYRPTIDCIKVAKRHCPPERKSEWPRIANLAFRSKAVTPQPPVSPRTVPVTKERWRGVGDVIASVTTALGIKKCGGCSKRQATLNRLLPFPGASSPLPESSEHG